MQGIIVLHPDKLGEDPSVGVDLVLASGVGHLEIRTAYGAHALVPIRLPLTGLQRDRRLTPLRR
ncbi:hypothetical protein ACVWZD_000478 [Streptomyces sp. TE3672]